MNAFASRSKVGLFVITLLTWIVMVGLWSYAVGIV